MQRPALLSLLFVGLLACSPAGAKSPSFYTQVGEVTIPDSAPERQKAIARDAAEVARDLYDAEIRKAYPCASTTDDQDIRDKLKDAKTRQLLGNGSDDDVSKIGELLNVDYVSFIHVGFVGDRILVTIATFRAGNAQRALDASARARGTAPLPSDPAEIAKTIEKLAKEVTNNLNIKKCTAYYSFSKIEKAGRFNVFIEGYSREGLFGQWDVYWHATALGDGVESSMFIKEDVTTSNEPDNLGNISGTGWTYQHLEMGDLESESRGTITVEGTATIGGGQDDPTITLTVSKFAIDMSGGGSIGKETFAQKAAMSGSKGDATISGVARGGGAKAETNMARAYFPEPKTYKLEKTYNRPAPKNVPQPPPPAPAKKATSADDEEDPGVDDVDRFGEKPGRRTPSSPRTDPGDRDSANEADGED